MTIFFQKRTRLENFLLFYYNCQKNENQITYIESRKKTIWPEFHIIGGDIMQEPREPLLKQLSKDLNIADKVVFHGQISDVKPILGNLDILVCASYEEAFPVSILEAMVCAFGPNLLTFPSKFHTSSFTLL